ncbi:hypothetical protein B9Z55_013118 [Caenorhabditis nigoni]|uniref:F-box domain-containing protein n=1 Tax=Caenorhabditis nigoni TaxID=1611254 RepID=A0A2G5U099_9PELO|nr:hypothetical protein B9Z55_013118 [Caenorhabditis nigoni]
MRLLKYPILLQEEIFSNMEYETIFPLSLMSRNVLKVLKQLNWKPVEVAFVFDSDRFHIHFGDSTISSYLISKSFVWQQTSTHLFDYADYETETVYNFEINGGSRREILLRMYKHFSELFQKCPKLKFCARIDTSDMNFYVPIPSLNIATFKEVSANDLTTFMRNHLDLKLLVLDEKPLGEIPDIINIRNMRVVCFEKNFLDYIPHFKGVNAYFYGYTAANDIHEFIDGWLNGKYPDNLRLIHIEKEYGRQFRLDLLENYRQNQWDLNRMPLEYELDERDKCYSQFPGPFKMENAVYVQRESDGKILSLQSISDIFIGCVWNREDVFRE